MRYKKCLAGATGGAVPTVRGAGLPGVAVGPRGVLPARPDAVSARLSSRGRRRSGGPRASSSPRSGARDAFLSSISVSVDGVRVASPLDVSTGGRGQTVVCPVSPATGPTCPVRTTGPAPRRPSTGGVGRRPGSPRGGCLSGRTTGRGPVRVSGRRGDGGTAGCLVQAGVSSPSLGAGFVATRPVVGLTDAALAV